MASNGLLKESPVSDRSRTALRESVVVILWVAGLLALLSLVSYHPLDPGFFSKSVGNFTKIPMNWVGGLGSYLADLLVGLLGFAALLVNIRHVLICLDMRAVSMPPNGAMRLQCPSRAGRRPPARRPPSL